MFLLERKTKDDERKEVLVAELDMVVLRLSNGQEFRLREERGKLNVNACTDMSSKMMVRPSASNVVLLSQVED